MKVLVPHYSVLKDRRKLLEDNLRQQGLSATWITAYDREELTDHQISEFVDQSLFRHKAEVTERACGLKPYHVKPLTRAEVSIAMKQLEILRNHSESQEGYILVLEDDVLFSTKKFVADFQRGLAGTPDDWDLIFFGDGGIAAEARPWRRFWNRLSGGLGVHKKVPPMTRCLDSYAVRSSAARRLSEKIKTISLPIDWELNYWLTELGLNVYWWDPSLTRQGSQVGCFESSIRGS